jgi:hypothetical protein
MGPGMRQVLMLTSSIAIAVIIAPWAKAVLAQGVTVPVDPADTPAPAEPIYPDAVMCKCTAPNGVIYKMIFYKSQTISFGSETNNSAEYGTTFLREPDKFDSGGAYKWRLQLGKPGNITLFTLPSGWTTDNCPVGKSIANLAADKQVFRFLTPQ